MLALVFPRGWPCSALLLLATSMFSPSFPWPLLTPAGDAGCLLNERLLEQGIAFESMMLTKYFSATCDPINPFCRTPGHLLATVVSPGISISPERLASMLTSRFGRSPSAYAIEQLGAGSFHFKVSSADIASEIALRGWLSSGCIWIALSLKKDSAQTF